MAEIRVEQKSSSTWIWWLLGLLVAALIIWAIVEAMDDDEVGVATVPAVTEPMVPPPADPSAATPATGTAGIPVGQIVASPGDWDGRNVTGEVRVGEVVSDRGFWIEADGQRMFALLNEVPGEVKEINAGQEIRMTNATVHATGDPSKIPGDLDQQAQQIAGSQGVVLTVDSLNVEILDPQPGLS